MGCLFGEGRSAEKKREAALFGGGAKGGSEKRLCFAAVPRGEASEEDANGGHRGHL